MVAKFYIKSLSSFVMKLRGFYKSRYLYTYLTTKIKTAKEAGLGLYYV